ncbi:hypothetical protein B0H16DRAFT_1379286 [Mycena metata]|uniref:histidine kinase n=1 Tax=Mycena metata TaxID=1033252 RepID=A0AAD7IBM2_9AGAR|nr:hypothetical protein B0H16DRAFT_1379286 [Mycena metata]
MTGEPVLPVYRTERRPVFHRTPGSTCVSPRRTRKSAVVARVRRLWGVCTTTPEGSLSDTFKLASTDNDAPTSATSDTSKIPAKFAAEGSVLDAIVVDNRDLESKLSARDKSDSSSTGFSSSDLDEDLAQHTGGLKSWLRHRAWPRTVEFFEPRFPEHEEDYQTQTWHSRKGLAFSASVFLVLNWGLYLILNNQSTKRSLYGQLVFWGGFSLFTLPTPFMVALDMPRRSEIFFQIWFCVAVWYCGFAEIIEMRQCQFFTDNHCFDKNFLTTSYYITGLPALMMFIVSKRLYNFIAQIVCFVLLVVLILPVQGLYTRNVVSFAVFSIFMQGLQYTSENDRRKLFLLALQLQQAFKAKHKARLSEAKAAFTKRRFANYIFHEVRVPLNTALLAFQLLQSGNALKDAFVNSSEFYALEQGLKMMSTVLNDVLDFEKMDSGHFETIATPFPLHHSIRTILDQVEVQGKTRNLILDRSLDERIDTVAVPGTEESEGLWVLGSELRLQQVLTNLASNAVKFTPEGGLLRISTEFLGISTRDELPGAPPDIDVLPAEGLSKELDNGAGPPAPARTGSPGTQTRCINLRVVVHDSGPGIKPSDLVEDKLFQPFAQTTLGRSIGSGTGLGLAIVKEIVRLSGGRLGVTSRPGEGSKFWVELSYPIASAAEIAAARDVNDFTVPLPLHYGHRNKDSGFIYGPLIASTPKTTASSTGTAQAEFVWPIPPEYENPSSQPSSPQGQSPDSLLVLVVDDDPLTRLLSSKLLTKLGCVVHTAKDGQECVNMVLGAAPRTYDLICLDNFMPVMTGEDAVKEIRAHARDDFVVGCTGNALTEDQESYREAGVDEVMVKPIMIHDFKRMIQLAQQRRLERIKVS